MRPRVVRSSAAEWVSAPTSNTFLTMPLCTMELAAAKPYRKPEHWLRTSIAGMYRFILQNPSFSCR